MIRHLYLDGEERLEKHSFGFHEGRNCLCSPSSAVCLLEILFIINRKKLHCDFKSQQTVLKDFVDYSTFLITKTSKLLFLLNLKIQANNSVLLP